MSTFHHVSQGANAGGVENIISVNDDGEIVARDVQSAAVNTSIVDQNKRMRSQLRSTGASNFMERGKLAARIPITLFQNWRREWEARHKDQWTWQTFLISRVNSREFDDLRLIDEHVPVPAHVAG